MKHCILLLIAILMTAGTVLAQNEVVRLSEPVERGEQYEVFGNAFNEDAEITPLTKLVENRRAYGEKQVVTEGTIKQVCQKKGCFFMLASGEYSARVTFKDYSFFIPTNSAGKKVKLAATFDVNELSEEKARHYAEDAGEESENIEGPQFEYSLVATSVKIMD